MLGMTDFLAATALVPAGELRWKAFLPEDWSQGRTTFGGVVGALAAEAAAQVAGEHRPVRSLDVAFVAPLPFGAVELEAEVLGEGRSVIQLAVSVRSGELLGARAHVVAGSS